MTSLSVIIPAYDHLDEVLTCLTSLQHTISREVPVEFLIQDDASPSVFFPAVIPPCAASVGRNPVNVGFIGNVNAAAQRAQGDVLFFVNQDVFAVPADASGQPFSMGWDKAIVSAFDDPQVGIVGAKLLNIDGGVQSAGGLFDIAGQPFHRCLGYSNHQCAETNTPETVGWVTGAALAIRRDLFATLGGLDTAYLRAYWEDVDLCMRAKDAGFKVWYEPRCQLVHRVGTSGGGTHFMHNAQVFKARWVDTNKVQSDTYAVKEHFWA